jgi:hypothetical protein
LALPVAARNGHFRFHTVEAEGSIPSTPTAQAANLQGFAAFPFSATVESAAA